MNPCIVWCFTDTRGVINLTQDFVETVTSSGVTAEFEVYDFDYFTNIITISVMFASEGDTISISEIRIGIRFVLVYNPLSITRLFVEIHEAPQR